MEQEVHDFLLPRERLGLGEAREFTSTNDFCFRISVKTWAPLLGGKEPI